MTEPATEVRKALQDARARGTPWETAWDDALRAHGANGWRKVLASQELAWARAFENLPASDAERALVALRGRAA